MWNYFRDCLVQKLVSWSTKLLQSLSTLLLIQPDLFFLALLLMRKTRPGALFLCYWSPHFAPQITPRAQSFSCLLRGIQWVQSEFLISCDCSALRLVIMLPAPVSASVTHLYLLLAEITQLGKQSCSITPGFDSWPIWLLVDSLSALCFIYS